MTKKTSNRFSPEVRQRAVRMVLDHGGDGTTHTREGAQIDIFDRLVPRHRRKMQAAPLTRHGCEGAGQSRPSVWF